MTDVAACAARIDDRGFPGRTPVVLARERAMYDPFAARVLGRGKGDPTGAGDRLTPAALEEALRGPAGTAGTVAATWLAGRCDCGDVASARIDGLLRAIVDAADPEELDAEQRPYVEALYSLALRGEVELGAAGLRALVADGGAGSTHDWLAAVYLAELGEPGGWPVLAAALDDRDMHARLMATRHLVHFAPYDGQVVDGEPVDLRARLLARVDDEDYVSGEVPGLLVELGGDDVVDDLRRIASTAAREAAREAAQDVLADLDVGADRG